jgi:hypothetical protein
MDVPSSTIELLEVLKNKYPDLACTDPDEVGTPAYWKAMGIVELVRELTYYIEQRGK